jgi:hypothetical protein
MEQRLPMNGGLDDDLIREVYAKFGLAYYHSECLHRELCMIFAWSGLPSRDLITRPRVEERLAHAFSLTLDDVAAKLEGMLPGELSGELRKAVGRRNFLAHHFWFERAHLMFSVENVHQLIAELDEYAELFDRLDTRACEWSEPKRRELGRVCKCGFILYTIEYEPRRFDQHAMGAAATTAPTPKTEDRATRP